MSGDKLDLADVAAELDEVRAAIDHGEAPYNPWALQALRVAEKLYAALRDERPNILT